jgi:hypothetical protein
LVRALAVAVPASRCDACCLWLVGPCISWRVGGTRDIPVEAVFPEGGERFELGSSGWSWVLGFDAVGRPPHCNVADEGRARTAFRWRPDWLGVTVAGVIVDLVGEISDELRSLRKTGSPNGMGLKRFWYAREPGQRT